MKVSTGLGGLEPLGRMVNRVGVGRTHGVWARHGQGDKRLKPEGAGEREQQEGNSRQVYRRPNGESEETVPTRCSRGHLSQDLCQGKHWILF